MPNTYTTLDEVRKYLTLASGNTGDDEFLTMLMNRASRAVDTFCRKRKFYPRVETRFYDLGDNSRLLKLDEDLLELTTFTTQNGASALASSILFKGTGKSWNYPPYDRIEFDLSSGSVMNYIATPQRSQRVLGVWGYHEEWTNAWTNTGTSLATAYTASGGSLELAGAGSANVGASDANYVAPRVAVGHLLKVDNEYFHALAGGASGNTTVLVQPYANGTTGASHAASTTVYKFEPESDIIWATLRLVGWLYGQKDTPYQVRTAFVNVGGIEIPDTLARDVVDKLDRFKRRTLGYFP